MPDPTSAQRSKRYRDRKKRGYRLVNGLRLSEIEIENLAARGYAAEPGFSLTAVVEAFVSDVLYSATRRRRLKKARDAVDRNDPRDEQAIDRALVAKRQQLLQWQ